MSRRPPTRSTTPRPRSARKRPARRPTTKQATTKATTARATSKATTRTATTNPIGVRSPFSGPSRMTALARRRRAYGSARVAPLALSFLAAVALSLPAAANAGDATLRATLAQWSHRIALDAQGIGLSAARRHPRRMTRRARHFRLDALRARKALAAVQPSSARGRRAKRLALAAFYDYAIVGRQWALSGQARVRGLRAAAAGHARIAARYARKGSALLVAAKRLLG